MWFRVQPTIYECSETFSEHSTICHYVCTLLLLLNIIFLLLFYSVSFTPFLSCLSLVSPIVFLWLSSALLSSLPSPNPEERVAAALYSPFPGEEALECSLSHSFTVQCCVLINSYQSSSCIQMLSAAQYCLHWKEKMKKTKKAVERERERERGWETERQRWRERASCR